MSLAMLHAAHAIEAASYPPDEAASRANLELRLTQASDYFWGAFEESAEEDGAGTLRGYVCGTLTSADRLTDKSMATHEPLGTTLCIHSVVVAEPFRRKGLGGWILRLYLDRVAAAGHATQALLLCKERLEPFYAAAGFESLGDSGVVHGADPWTLMRLQLQSGDA